LLVVVVTIAAVGPLAANWFGVPDPNATPPDGLDPRFGGPAGPHLGHLLGFDAAGRDVLSRLLHGGAVTVAIALFATLLAVCLGTIIGCVLGYGGGLIDAVFGRIVDGLLAFPFLLLALGIGAACSGPGGCLGGSLRPGAPLVAVCIGIAGAPVVARIVRGQVLSVREEAFVESARALGGSPSWIARTQVLPQLAAPLCAYASLALPGAVVAEAGLAYLGIGAPPTTPTWGTMLASGATVFPSAWWALAAPAIAIALFAVGFYLVADALAGALDPTGG
jgi:peptide/nickel transport system permease protein